MVKAATCRLCGVRHWSWEGCEVGGVEPRESVVAVLSQKRALVPAVIHREKEEAQAKAAVNHRALGYPVTIEGARCKCGHTWVPKAEPKTCPKCKSRKWAND